MALNAEIADKVKAYYTGHSETNWVKRYNSPYALRRYFSRTMWEVIGREVHEHSLVLDAGCGDGVLAVLLALENPHRRVVAVDISEEGVRRTRHAAAVHGVLDRLMFVVADVERFPFRSGVFPAIVCSQVLEHLPDFDQGVHEIRRVLHEQGRAVLAIPVCCNLSAMVLLGGDSYWRIGPRMVYAFWKGLIRVLLAFLRGEEGVQEGYGGDKELPHIRRFPWRAVRRVESGGVKVDRWMADSLLIPYAGALFPPLLGLQFRLDRGLRRRRFWRNLGMGLVMVAHRTS